MAKKIQKANPGTIKKVLSYIGKYKLLLPISMLFALITVALTLYVPILIGDAIDMIIGKGAVNFDGIRPLLIKAAILIGITALSQWLMSTINNRIAYHVARDIRNDAFSHIERLPLSYIDSHSRGDTVNRVINDTERFSEGLLLGFTQVFTGVLTILGTLVFMVVINPIIAAVVVLLTPISIFIARFISSRTYSMFRERSETEGEETALIEEMLGNQKVVKAFSHENEAVERFNEINSRLEKAALRAIFFSSLTNPTTRFINSIVYAATALVGAIIAISTAGTAAAFTVGEFACILSYSNQYTKPFNEISGIFAEFQNALASASRVFELIEAPAEIPDGESSVVLESAEGNVELSKVSFSYSPSKPLIADLNLSVKPGQRVAIVGPTGCGKTTVINLLMRFYDVCGGSISVDGHDLRDITRDSLRTSYGMVLQETWLKSGTVRENIAFGKPDATDEEIIAAAKAAHAHSFIKRLKNGYDTRIGEGGEELSEGQKQLLCITRVMLALPPLLILDEATSSIDTRTEMRIQKAFAELMRGRTSFIVAHRLSTIREADVILVMKDGHIIESGTHDELLAKGGFYHELYNSQFAH
ncbi:MAG: ABC transporter ATP-binding protein [Clostridia bacterium]|nr:ABC transporter ATP-binding protein [Clostridia bacterium]